VLYTLSNSHYVLYTLKTLGLCLKNVLAISYLYYCACNPVEKIVLLFFLHLLNFVQPDIVTLVCDIKYHIEPLDSAAIAMCHWRFRGLLLHNLIFVLKDQRR
jgi:hypothetical protein